MTEATIHASAVRIGSRAVLIRGPSGSGKSRLAFSLILAGRSGIVPPAILVGDDRLRLMVKDNRLIVSAPAELAGVIEIHGLGLRRIEAIREAEVGHVVDLAAADASRLPAHASTAALIQGIEIPRISIPSGDDGLLLVLAALTTDPAGDTLTPAAS